MHENRDTPSHAAVAETAEPSEWGSSFVTGSDGYNNIHCEPTDDTALTVMTSTDNIHDTNTNCGYISQWPLGEYGRMIA